MKLKIIVGSNNMELCIAQMSFIPLTQKKLLSKRFSGTPIELAESLLRIKTQYRREKKKKYVNLIFDNFIEDANGDLIGGKLGRDIEKKLPKHNDEGFYKKIDELSPFVDFFWERSEQILLVEKNSSVFNNYENVFNSIQAHLNNLLEEYDYNVYIEPITEEKNFWEAYEKFKWLFEVTFELHMPNLGGMTQENLKKSLNKINEDTNATSYLQSYFNPDGKLKLDRADPIIEMFLKWVINGGGSWKMRGKSVEGSKRETLTSKKSVNIKTESVCIELNDYSAEEVKSIFSYVIPKITDMRRKRKK
ncbi:MAG: hypothetical protein QCI00_07905 [Candidatus Thermoplasmatota archaeon]|nr:hypothetical protein [Candidatus Thermoplasmatota archaeon]